MRRNYIIVGGVVITFIVLGMIMPSLKKSKTNEFSHNNEVVASSSTGVRKGITRYIDPSTGKVNREAVDEMASSVPPYLYGQVLSRAESKIQDAVDSGSLSEDQANQLKEALREDLQ